jgi:hypothetical protein
LVICRRYQYLDSIASSGKITDELERNCKEVVVAQVTVSEFVWLATCFHVGVFLELFNTEDGGEMFL